MSPLGEPEDSISPVFRGKTDVEIDLLLRDLRGQTQAQVRALLGEPREVLQVPLLRRVERDGVVAGVRDPWFRYDAPRGGMVKIEFRGDCVDSAGLRRLTKPTEQRDP
jgi:hypothetical protein